MLKGFGDRLLALLFLADATLTCLALLLAEVGRRQLPIGDPVTPEPFIKPPILLAAALIWPFFLRLFGAYDTRRTRTFLEELRAVVPAVGVSTLVLIGFFFLFEFRFVSRILVVYFVVLDLLFLLNFRLFARVLVNWLASSGRLARRLLIVDAGTVGQELASLIGTHPWSGLSLVGYVDDDPARSGSSVSGFPILGTTAQMAYLVQRHDIDDVIVALPAREHEKISRVVLDLLPHPVQVKVVPERFEMISVRSRVEDFWGVPLIGIRDPVITGFDRVTKRLFDLLIGGAATLLLLPVMVALAVAVKLDFPRPRLLRPLAGGAERAPVPDVEVPHHGGGGRPAAPAQGEERPPHHPRGAHPAALEPGRAAQSLERPLRGDEPGGAPPGAALDRGALRALAAQAPRRPAGDDRLVAGERALRPALARERGVRPLLRAELLPPAGPDHPVQDHPGCAQRARRVLTAQWAKVPIARSAPEIGCSADGRSLRSP